MGSSLSSRTSATFLGIASWVNRMIRGFCPGSSDMSDSQTKEASRNSGAASKGRAIKVGRDKTDQSSQVTAPRQNRSTCRGQQRQVVSQLRKSEPSCPVTRGLQRKADTLSDARSVWILPGRQSPVKWWHVLEICRSRTWKMCLKVNTKTSCVPQRRKP